MMIDLEHPILVHKFNKLGINPEALSNLPSDVKTALRNGVPTSIIMISMETEDGSIAKLPAKLKTGFNSNGEPDILIFGIRDNLSNIYDLPEKDFEKLKSGVIVVREENGSKVFMQFDKESNNIISLSENELNLDDKLKSIEKIRGIELGVEQKTAIREGKPVVLDIGGQKSTLGIDLTTPNLFKLLKGDMEEWKRQQEIDYDIAHPEYVGIVQTEENRWEYFEFQRKGWNSKELTESPKQVKHGSMQL